MCCKGSLREKRTDKHKQVTKWRDDGLMELVFDISFIIITGFFMHLWTVMQIILHVCEHEAASVQIHSCSSTFCYVSLIKVIF